MRGCRCCGEFLRGRSDKVFCDDRCRNQYHNRLQKRPGLSEGARMVQRQLLRNRHILRGLLGEKKRRLVMRDGLLRSGFSFDYFSHRSVFRKKVFCCCLDVGYRVLQPGRVELLCFDPPQPEKDRMGL